MLRIQRIPIRVRYEFATYFDANFFTDHVVCEYWHEQHHCWVLIDAQIDTILQQAYNITIDPLDLLPTAFLLTGQAWKLYRSAQTDPARFGISSSGPCGVSFIRMGLLCEVAALNKAELLCQQEWDFGEGEHLQLMDQRADWTLQADTSHDHLRAIFDQGVRLAVPSQVRRYA